MKILLWAYHEAGYRAFRKLYAQGHDLLVFTEEAAPYVPSVIEIARALEVPVHVGVSAEEMHEVACGFGADLGISMYYPRLVKEDVLDLPRNGAFNFHPSLLPMHRGCFSAPWAILDGDTETGVTCHEMLAEVDRGRVLCQTRVPVTVDDTAFSLYYKLVDSALTLLEDAISQVVCAPLLLVEQKEGGSYHRREIPFDGTINMDWPEEMVDRFIRAMYFPPHLPAKLEIGEKTHWVTSLADYKRLSGK